MSIPWLEAQKWCDWELTRGPNLKAYSIRGGVCMERVYQKSRKYSRQLQLLPARRETDTASKGRFLNYFRRHFSNFQIGYNQMKNWWQQKLQVKQGHEATWPRRLCQDSRRCPGRDSCNKMWFVHCYSLCWSVSSWLLSHSLVLRRLSLPWYKTEGLSRKTLNLQSK